MFSVVAASIPGSDHTLPGKPLWKNNQDSFYCSSDDEVTIAIVSDGCGSGASSEVGAKIAVAILGTLIRSCVLRGSLLSFERIRVQLLGSLSVLASSMGESFSKIVNDYFLFSLLGVVITKKKTYIFSCGDGMYRINDEEVVLGPFPNNAPPYIAYGLLGELAPSFLVTTYDTDCIKSVVLATDGFSYLKEHSSCFASWVKDDALFENKDALRRRISRINLERVSDGLLIPGPLKDDFTVVLLRPNVEKE